MRHSIILALAGNLLFISPGFTASVDYEHPNVSIVAVDESLESVLRAVGKEMKISVTLPLGLNPTINCDIVNKPVKKALKTLLSDLSYSMQWTEGGERLVGVVIMSDNSAFEGTTTVNSTFTGASNVSPAIGEYPSSRPVSSIQPSKASYADSAAPGAPGSMDHEQRMDEQQERHRAKREEQEARFREARVEEEARHREARLEEEAQTRQEDEEYDARERALFANGGPEL